MADQRESEFPIQEHWQTRQGENKKKVREQAAAIRKRLDATLATPAPSATPTLTLAPPVSPT